MWMAYCCCRWSLPATWCLFIVKTINCDAHFMTSGADFSLIVFLNSDLTHRSLTYTFVWLLGSCCLGESHRSHWRLAHVNNCYIFYAKRFSLLNVKHLGFFSSFYLSFEIKQFLDKGLCHLERRYGALNVKKSLKVKNCGAVIAVYYSFDFCITRQWKLLNEYYFTKLYHSLFSQHTVCELNKKATIKRHHWAI